MSDPLFSGESTMTFRRCIIEDGAWGPWILGVCAFALMVVIWISIPATEYHDPGWTDDNLTQVILFRIFIGINVALIILLFAFAIWIRRFRRKYRSGRYCYDCGYELAGLTSDRCPECGSSIEIREPNDGAGAS